MGGRVLVMRRNLLDFISCYNVGKESSARPSRRAFSASRIAVTVELAKSSQPCVT